ncbi:hypothetical protein [Sphingomonas sp. MMS24-J13]|uniref:hypothetical protein n=1 Tax=Sphingomonas sp. MMS24-J13 TaxID=3238686 RepID=UPI00384BEEA9
MRIATRAVPIALVLLLAACSTPPAPPPRPAVTPPPAPKPVVPAPTSAIDWRDIPQTPGRWTYSRDASGTAAVFTETGGSADFILHCNLPQRTVTLSRPGTTGAVTLTTSYSPTTWASLPVSLVATDPFLDKIAFTRGRFTVESPGTTRLVLPAWAEPARVIEDCRG